MCSSVRSCLVRRAGGTLWPSSETQKMASPRECSMVSHRNLVTGAHGKHQSTTQHTHNSILQVTPHHKIEKLNLTHFIDVTTQANAPVHTSMHIHRTYHKLHTRTLLTQTHTHTQRNTRRHIFRTHTYAHTSHKTLHTNVWFQGCSLQCGHSTEVTERQRECITPDDKTRWPTCWTRSWCLVCPTPRRETYLFGRASCSSMVPTVSYKLTSRCFVQKP